MNDRPDTNRVCRILVVEDPENEAFRLQRLLEEQGWPVSIAATAVMALSMRGDLLPDLILLDDDLPGMRGDEFCRRLRTNLNTLFPRNVRRRRGESCVQLDPAFICEVRLYRDLVRVMAR